ncbi:uncharacterized protein LOC132757144 isoform X2 [Ruditapes philippinarum]|uniref:uncharacterized protein LOC132757144 isoform X2 n=1 Tax=Ruditapes philippinarum TaxID=129788 RepID=UPI00295AC22A|nr:uncharacterized protein LOC132757144 isoform X2 [Ruditapes philippinarum]
MRVLGKLQRNLTQGSIRTDMPTDMPDNENSIRKRDRSNNTISCLCWSFKRKRRFPTIRTPDARSDIYIPHTGADKPMGDEFGARLITFRDNRKDGSPYYRHFLERIVQNGPADQMRIDDRDELVLVNEKFAPQFTHDAVCDMFRRVKVDGKTRFTLVIRRIQENRKRKWEWIETSAILAPDKTIEEHPTIENLKFKELESDEIEFPISQHLYKVPQTQQYLDVCDGSVKLGVMKGNKSDRSKVIWKKAKYWQDNNDDIHINFAAALVDYTKKWYIAIDGGKIVLKKEPYWFKMITIGGKIRFQADDVYLGYDTTRCEVKPEVSQCTFEELPANDVDNEINADEHFEILPENADTISEEMSRHSSMSSLSSGSSRSKKSFASSVSSSKSVRSSTSSQSSVDSDRSSILSSQSSTDSGGITHEFNRSSSDVSGHCCEPSSLSHSFSSESSGYRSGYKSDQHVNTEDIDIVKPTDISVKRKTEMTGECILTDSLKDVVI